MCQKQQSDHLSLCEKCNRLYQNPTAVDHSYLCKECNRLYQNPTAVNHSCLCEERNRLYLNPTVVDHSYLCKECNRLYPNTAVVDHSCFCEERNRLYSNPTAVDHASLCKERNQLYPIPTAVYCRVSTTHQHQQDSLENQIRHYRDFMENHPNYTLTKIYYDLGISGYKEQRPGFMQMLQDAEAGCFRQIITKSITRFSRNTDTILKTTRQLKNLDIDVYFELQKIHTLSQEGELLLTLYAAFGQAESENARWLSQTAVQRNYEKGKPIRQLHRCLGYEKDKNGELVPDKNAGLVRQLFWMAAEGWRIGEITRYLNENRIKTQNGKAFSRSTVSRILHNHAYKGDYICQRYYVNNRRKLVRNKGERKMYYIRRDHVAIVSEELWERAQAGLKRSGHNPLEQLPAPRSGQIIAAQPAVLSTTHTVNQFAALLTTYIADKRVSPSATHIATQPASPSTPPTAIQPVSMSTPYSATQPALPSATYRANQPALSLIAYTTGQPTLLSMRPKPQPPRLEVPALTLRNYPYKDRIFCKYCGSRLRRIIARNRSVWWICNGLSRRGKAFCKGIRIPDGKLTPLRSLNIPVYIGKEPINGKETYGYSTQPDERK